jgi:ZIP family zinc transporter
MLEAAAFAAVGQAALIVGALLVWRFHSLTRAAVVGSLMAFGAGAVISAVSTDLVAVAYDEAGGGVTALGIGIGGVGYFLIIALLERSGASEKPQSTLEEAVEEESDGEVAAASPTEARNLFVGMVVDGVPESVAVGLSLHLGSIGVSAALVGSIFIAGLPEAIGVAAALLAGGFTISKIIIRFGFVVLIGAISGVVGYRLLYGQSDELIALIQSIAAGALLVVVVNEMVPIAIRGIQRWAGVVAASGFVFSAAITWLSGG